MKSLPAAIAIAIAILLVVSAWAFGSTASQPSRPASIGHAAVYAPTMPSMRIGGGGVSITRAWHPYPTRGTTHFAQLWQQHPECGRPIDRERRLGLLWFQRFRHCVMQDTVTIISARSTPQPQPVLPTPAPVRPADTPVQPTDTPAPVQQPTQAVPPSDPVAYELYLMNQTRASYGLPPYTLNQTESDGTGSCVGSHGHALHMSQTGVLAHDQFPADICVPVRAAAENIGYAGGSVQSALQTTHSEMMAEPHSPGCSGNHACSILSPSYSQVGIGVVTVNGTTWMTVDFLG